MQRQKGADLLGDACLTEMKNDGIVCVQTRASAHTSKDTSSSLKEECQMKMRHSIGGVVTEKGKDNTPTLLLRLLARWSGKRRYMTEKYQVLSHSTW